MTVFCRNCKFWEPIEDSQGFGLCRFNAPVTDIAKMPHGDKGHGALWPVTDDIDYCSHHVPWENAEQMIDAEHVDPEDAEGDII